MTLGVLPEWLPTTGHKLGRHSLTGDSVNRARVDKRTRAAVVLEGTEHSLMRDEEEASAETHYLRTHVRIVVPLLTDNPGPNPGHGLVAALV